jgi:hypothetical protein
LLPAVYGLLIAAAPAWAGPAEAQEPDGPLFVLLFGIVSFPALALVLWALATAPLSAICDAMARGRGRCLVTGTLAAAVGLVLLSVLGQSKGLGELVAALVMGLLALGALTGLVAVTALLGQEVMGLTGRDGSRALSVVAGAVLLIAAGLFPLVGQVLLIYFVLVGTGGAIHALVGAGRRRK